MLASNSIATTRPAQHAPVFFIEEVGNPSAKNLSVYATEDASVLEGNLHEKL
jgi:hypothetical protein